MKKVLSIMMVCLMLIGLVGCSSKEVTDTSSTQTNNTEVNSQVSSGDADITADSTSPDSSDTASGNTSSTAESPDSKEPEKDETPAEPEVFLKDLYAEYGMKAGTCLTTQMITNKKYNDLILSQFSSITMENAMKPDSILNKTKSQETGKIVIEFNKDVIKMLDWAKENGMAVRGHTIVWYSQTPDWIFREGFVQGGELVGREEMLARLDSMMSQIFGQLKELGYIDLFYAYDVINEAWMEDGTKRENNWLKTIGDDYMWQAFYYADKYAPESIDLYYNDYNEQFKTATFVNFVKTLVDDSGRYLIDGIGLQAHLYTNDSLPQYLGMLDTLSETGLKLEITELDVSLGAWQNTLKGTPENLAKQGRFYYELISGIIERINAGTLKMDSITFWGFSDNLSWRREAKPLLFDAVQKKKPAFYGAAQLRDLAGY